MQKIPGKNIFLVFWVIALLDICGILFDIRLLHLIFKPLLMPVLLAAVVMLTKSGTGRTKIICALIFSFLGDVFLLFEPSYPVLFIPGLVCFLVTHVYYIFYFLQLSKQHPTLIKTNPLLALLILLYTGSLLFLLIPGLGSLLIPVIIYACVISTMLYSSLSLPNTISPGGRQLFIAGAVCFVLSDSLLAIDKFYKQFPYAGVLIMVTYCSAQFFIVKGYLKTRVTA